MEKENLPNLLLRVALAFAFLYPPIAALFDPYSWIGYFPPFMLGFVPDAVLLHSFGLLEVVIALWILFGKNIFWPSALAAVILLGIIIFDWNQMDVIFRDISILLVAKVLALESYRKTGFAL